MTNDKSKNIVVCCDGTGQKLDVARTNVVRLFEALDRTNGQVAYYDPGVGTMPAAAALTPLTRRLTRWAGLMAGYGVLDNVAKAYGFIVDKYTRGDRIYLLGFSRGALTVRLIGGLLHRMGVLRPDATNLIPYALELYGKHYTHIRDKAGRDQVRKVNEEFRKVFSVDGTDPVDIRFLGVWDTVKAFGVLRPSSFPHLRHNPSIKTVRHAIALDERRRSFMFTSWGGLRDFVEADPPQNQDVKEVWFAGDHSDVGGGHPEQQSVLSELSFRWMVGEACRARLKFCDADLAKISLATIPAVLPKPHESSRWWRLLDLLPRYELENAPARARYPSLHLEEGEPDLPVPLGWPKRRLRAGTVNRHPEHHRRIGPLLLHSSLQRAEAGQYKLDGVCYVEDTPLLVAENIRDLQC